MYLVAIAWGYVVLMMAVAEATSSNGTVLGALVTFTLYGVFPLSIVLYLMGTPARRRAAKASEAADNAGMIESPASDAASIRPVEPDGSSHAPGGAVAPEREKP